jgi:tripartite-type tricarboxylate transporter receptor subunit TctC
MVGQLPASYRPWSIGQIYHFDGSTCSGFLAPRNTPGDIIKNLHDAAVAATETLDVQEQLAKNGTYVAPLRAAGVSVD